MKQLTFAVTLLLLENRYSYVQLDREPEECVHDRFAARR